MPRYLTEDSSLECPSSNCTAEQSWCADRSASPWCAALSAYRSPLARVPAFLEQRFPCLEVATAVRTLLAELSGSHGTPSQDGQGAA
jgi:hypothetical protein